MACRRFQEVKRQARYTHFAVAAAKQAIEDSKLDLDKCDRSRVGCLVGESAFVNCLVSI
jgi:3-oxoacyl-[acyl-carrier-protein] synthase II